MDVGPFVRIELKAAVTLIRDFLLEPIERLNVDVLRHVGVGDAVIRLESPLEDLLERVPDRQDISVRASPPENGDPPRDPTAFNEAFVDQLLIGFDVAARNRQMRDL